MYTQVLWGNLDPQWGESHVLYVPKDASQAVLRLRVVDKNKLVADVDLGAAMTGLAPLLDQPGQRVTLPLKGAAERPRGNGWPAGL